MCQEALTASEDIYSYLEQNQIPNSVNNIIAVKEMFRNPNQMFATLFSPKGDSFDKKQAVKELKDMVLERFGEAIKTPEELAEAQETLAEVAEHAMDDMILEQDSVSTLDIRRLQLMNRQFTICAQQSKEESYMIPVQTGDSITGVSLKIVRGTKKKGFVDILFENEKIGKVAASFHAKEQGISGMVATDRKDTKQLFSDHLETMCEQLRSEEEEEVDIRTALVKDLSLEQYAMHAEDRNMKKGSIGRADLFDSQEEAAEEETVSVQTKRLYHIAESFVRMITNMGE
jgi:hypothetical protein